MLRQIIRVSTFWREYAGGTPVEMIDDKVMRDFIPKLPKNARLHPTDKTLQWDMMLGKAVVKWAHEQGLRGKQALPTVTFTPKRKRVRPAFERWEYCRLWRTLCKRVKTARTKRTHASRVLLQYYVLVLANSGIRPGEANKLNVRDVHLFKDEKGRSNYRLVVRGKTGERDAIVRSVAAKRLDKYLTKRRAEASASLLFIMPDGSRIGTLIDQLDAALKELKRTFLVRSIQFTVCVTSMQSTHYAMGLACSRSPATWGPRFKLFRNITGSRPPSVVQGWGIELTHPLLT
jgi:integrase